MTYLTLNYLILCIATFVLYYLIPLKARWVVLLLASVFFYYMNGWDALIVMAVSGILCWVIGKGIVKKKSKGLLALGVVLCLVPLVTIKVNQFHIFSDTLIYPLGVSFYSLQLVSYLVDLYKEKVEEEKNPFRFFLYVLWFPQIIQGPITRIDKAKEILKGHAFSEENVTRGIQLVIWGLFLKYMIAEKAGVIVDTVFADTETFGGLFVLMAGILYSIQLYTDFLSCVKMSQGVSWMFGVQIIDNFNRPYFAESIGEFWRRWHISLSSWLRDYVYIPLGGNRKGAVRKYINLMLTFLVSGFWHGNGWNFIFWGALHGVYQIGENLIFSKKKKTEKGTSQPIHFVRILITDFLAMIAWIFFRTDTVRHGFEMILSIAKDFNPWILGDSAIWGLLNTDIHEAQLLLVMILVLFFIEVIQEYKKVSFGETILKQNIIIRWVIYLTVIAMIWVMGTYGNGFDAKAFIYGGF